RLIVGRGRSARDVHADRGVAQRHGRSGDERRGTDTAGAGERHRRREPMSTTRTSDRALGSAARDTAAAPPDRPPSSQRLWSALAVDKIGAVYVWIAIIIVFTIWAPDTFPTLDTAKQILNTNAVTGLAALAILIPLSARVFDLSFAYVMTLSGVVVAKLVTHGTPLGLAILIGLLVGVGIGLVNASIVVLAKIDSFIGTL